MSPMPAVAKSNMPFSRSCFYNVKILLTLPTSIYVLKRYILYGYIYVTMEIVLDSNVIYAGLYSNKGASYQILKEVRDEKINPVLTVSLYEEYSDILSRPPLSNVIEENEIEGFLDFFCKKAYLQDIFFLWRPFLKDPKDDMVLEAAVASQSEIIITHNIRDFEGLEKFGIEAMLPGCYLKRKGAG